MLSEAGIEEADAEARECISHFACCSFGDALSLSEREADFSCDDIIKQRINGRPLAYIINEKFFYGLSFYVDERVLIPRYDTEILVEEALGIINKGNETKVLDLCCGSGCIGLSVASNSDADVILSDISDDALDVARINSGRLGLEEVSFVKSDLFEDVSGSFDVILSNPPYVTEEEYACLDNQVRDFEPESALLGGLDFYRRIIPAAVDHLEKGGKLLLEIGCSQADDVSGILEENGYNDICCVKDLAQRDRVIICTKN